MLTARGYELIKHDRRRAKQFHVRRGGAVVGPRWGRGGTVVGPWWGSGGANRGHSKDSIEKCLGVDTSPIQ